MPSLPLAGKKRKVGLEPSQLRVCKSSSTRANCPVWSWQEQGTQDSAAFSQYLNTEHGIVESQTGLGWKGP